MNNGSTQTIPVNLKKSARDVIYAKVGDMNLPGNEEFITISSRYVDLAQINKNQIIPFRINYFSKKRGSNCNKESTPKIFFTAKAKTLKLIYLNLKCLRLRVLAVYIYF